MNNSQLFDVDNLLGELETDLEELIKGRSVIREINKSAVSHPEAKLRIFLTVSILKTHLLGIEILNLAKDNRFLPAIATLRMLFEELIYLFFTLSTMESFKDWKSADYFLTRLSIGRKSRKETAVPAERIPYNISTALDKAEGYLSRNFKDLNGMFGETYTFISDFVHPNAPSRYYFWNDTGDKIGFTYRTKVPEQDIGMLLNCACMSTKMYRIGWDRLNNLQLLNQVRKQGVPPQ